MIKQTEKSRTKPFLFPGVKKVRKNKIPGEFMKRIIIFILLAASAALAQPRMMERNTPQKHGYQQGENLVKKLDLKDDQLVKFKKLRSQLRIEQIDLRAKVQTLRVELRDLFDTQKPDKMAIESKVGEISKLQGELKLKMITFWFDVNSILTAEQQKIWKRMPRAFLRENRERRMSGRRHGMGMPERWNSHGKPGGDEPSDDSE
jgi:Spy/CpxP family protein refolding chaperone